MAECPRCLGEGTIYGLDNDTGEFGDITCPKCDGDG